MALALAGPAGAIKWVDNFGVQILIYVMLAWGLNIVVGLAGLLDLGYVAFYAVGAYTYAIIASLRDPGDGARAGTVGVLDLPADRRHPRRASGASSSAFPCCACAAITWPSSRSPSAR